MNIDTAFLACPRACGVDVRGHHSTDQVNGGCDTGPMSLDDMSAWFAIRGAGWPGMATMAELIREFYGKTEAELTEIYEAMQDRTADHDARRASKEIWS